jgi:uncharacterized tellurite resistance protein B-like protein
VLSPAERSFLGVLQQVLPEDVNVLPKVRLGDVFVTRSGLTNSERASAWNRINQKHVDFLLVKKADLAPIAGIELDDRSHEREERKQRDAFVDEVFGANAVPLLHLKARTSYALAELRSQVSSLLRGRPTAPSPKLQRDISVLADETLRAVERIIELTNAATPNTAEADRKAHADEVQESVMALMAAVVIADGMIHTGEQEFLRHLSKSLETEEQCRQFVTSYAESWKEVSRSAPKYFDAVIQHDRETGTRYSLEIIDQLRLIVQNTGLSDGHYADSDFEAASAHLALLDSVVRKATWVVNWDEQTAPPKINFANSLRRDQFSKREVS